MSDQCKPSGLFLAYTKFHLASFIRAVSCAKFDLLERIFVFIPHKIAGKSCALYIEKLLAQCKEKSIKIRVSSSIVELILFLSKNLILKILGQRLFFITGNLRRAPSLVLANICSELYLVDEGTGTTHHGGYLDPCTLEKNKIKRFLARWVNSANYKTSYNKVSNHYTSFPRSIYKNFTKIPFCDLNLLVEIPPEIPQKIVIYVASSPHTMNTSAYIEVAERLISRSNICNSHVYYAPHPADSENMTTEIISHFGWRILDTNGLLLEDFVALLLNHGVSITIIGEKNTSTELLSLYGGDHENLHIQV